MVKKDNLRRSSDDRIIKMENDIDHIKQGMTEVKIELKESHKNLEDKLDALMQKIEDRFNKHEKNNQNNYAAKWTEEALKYGITTIMGAVIVAIMYVILK